jgi:hypothetical protein
VDSEEQPVAWRRGPITDPHLADLLRRCQARRDAWYAENADRPVTLPPGLEYVQAELDQDLAVERDFREIQTLWELGEALEDMRTSASRR